MKTIKKAILILASVISLSVICGCKQEPENTDRELTNTCYPIESFKVEKDTRGYYWKNYSEEELKNIYRLIPEVAEDKLSGGAGIYIYENTTNDLKSAKRVYMLAPITSTDYCYDESSITYHFKVSAHAHSNIDTYYFWGYIADYDYNTHEELYYDPRKSGITPKVFTYEFVNEILYPKNLKVEYSSEILNEIVVTWDSVEFYDPDSDYNRYFLYTNTVNDISSAKKVEHSNKDYFDSKEELIYKQFLLEDQQLYFWIQVDNINYSDISEPVFLDFKHKKPDAPKGFTAEESYDEYGYIDYVTLKLNEASPNPKLYKIYCAEENDFSKATSGGHIYSTKEIAESEQTCYIPPYFSSNKNEKHYKYRSYKYKYAKTLYFWIKAADTPDEDANPETESELVGPVSVHR